MNPIIKQRQKTFEDIRQQTEGGVEFWSARDLHKMLDYSSWDKFKLVVHKAVKACEKSQKAPFDYFSQVGKKVKTGLGVECYTPDYDYHLTCYTCYLIVQNGDPSKLVIAGIFQFFKIMDHE